MGSRSKRKGKLGELEASKELNRALGIEARRGQQFCGGSDAPDVITSLPQVHFEVKRCESFRLWAALEQATSDAGAGQVPVVLHRANHQPWVVILRLENLLQLAREIAQHDTASSSSS